MGARIGGGVSTDTKQHSGGATKVEFYDTIKVYFMMSVNYQKMLGTFGMDTRQSKTTNGIIGINTSARPTMTHKPSSSPHQADGLEKQLALLCNKGHRIAHFIVR